MDIVEFKKMLKVGKVNFTYIKKDGTKRNAVGTLCEALLPKTPNMVKFKCTSIHWDTDNAEVDLPSKMTVQLDESMVNATRKTGAEKLDDLITATIANMTGYCPCGYIYERVEKRAPKKLPEGTIFYYDIDKAGFRSFNESQLVDYTEVKEG